MRAVGHNPSKEDIEMTKYNPLPLLLAVLVIGFTSTGTCPDGSAPKCETATPAKKAKTVDKPALAKRWGAVYDVKADTFSCTVPAGQAGSGQNCWSPDYETTGKWDWAKAPTRYSVTRSKQVGSPTYLYSGGFYALEVEKGLVTGLATMKTVLETAIAGKADQATVDLIQATINDIQAARANRDTEVAWIKDQIATLTQRMSAVEADLVHHDDRITALEADVGTIKGDIQAVKESDTRQNRELRARPIPGLGIEVGMQASVGNPVTNGLEGDDLRFRRIPYGFGLAVAGNFTVCSAEASCFLLQAGITLAPSDAGGTGFGAFANLGGEFLVKRGVTAGPLLGYQWRRHGMRNGGASAESSEGAFGAFLRIALPIAIAPAVPGITFTVQGLGGTTSHDPDGTGTFTPEASYGVLGRVSFSIGTPLRKSEIPDET